MKNITLSRIDALRQVSIPLLPGIGFCLVVVLAANYMAEHYGSPLILMALLLGMAFNNIYKYEEFSRGLEFCAKSILRMGVALLGVRITFDQISELGFQPVLVVVVVVIATIAFSVVLARTLKVDKVMGIISGAAVAICGVSAAMAVAAVLPTSKASEKYLLCTVICVTGLSTIVMVLYPGAVTSLDMSPEQMGIFLGASIHDVAQVFGAGHMISEQVAELATYTKMLRVMMLVPVIMVLVILFRKTMNPSNESQDGYKKLVLVPGFLIAFTVLVIVSNLEILAPTVVSSMEDLSGICLLIAMAALGTKTNLVELYKVGRKPFLLLLSNTIFIAVLAFCLIL
ncbi:MAG: putative integral membrane protein (TIGR00698 family) [Oceanicoccus sp.]|jgi:uncharacterized integral membrane protein (TIGR00698 family)